MILINAYVAYVAYVTCLMTNSPANLRASALEWLREYLIRSYNKRSIICGRRVPNCLTPISLKGVLPTPRFGFVAILGHDFHNRNIC